MKTFKTFFQSFYFPISENKWKFLWILKIRKFRSARDNGSTATPHLMRHCHNFFKALQLGASSSFFNSNRMAETNFSLADWTHKNVYSEFSSFFSLFCSEKEKALMSSKNKVVRAKLIQLRVSSFSLRDISVKNRNGVELKGAARFKEIRG